MNARFLLTLLAALAVAPAALAHPYEGTPKDFCEPEADWRLHDYGPLGTGLLTFLARDGNLSGDCDGDTVPADSDGHMEYALGGGWLMVETGDGVTSGTLACYGEMGHHPMFGPVSAYDVVPNVGLKFFVGATASGPAGNPNGPDCGDFAAAFTTACTDFCHVTFPPGPDGAYVVFIGDGPLHPPGVAGHFETP